MIFIALTVHFCAGNLLFIHYSLLINCSLDSNHHPSDLKWRKNCIILRGFELASFQSAFHAATTELLYKCLWWFGDFSCIPHSKTTLIKFVVWFYFSFFRACSNFLYIASLSIWVVRVVDCRCDGSRFKYLQNFSCDS